MNGFDAVSALEHFAAGKSYDLFPKELNVDFQCHVGHVDGGEEEVGRRRRERREEETRRRGGKGNYLLFPSPPLPLWRTLYSSAGPGPAGISSITCEPKC